jgi:galactan endo-beta-1,3-galactanase
MAHTRLLSRILYLAIAATIADPGQAAKTIIPISSLSSQQEFDTHWGHLYPWGSDHNGAARMDKANVKLLNGTVTLTAQRVNGQRSATHGGKQIAIKYLSGAIHAKEHFTVTKGGGLDFKADLKATTTKGTWPAWWLTYVDGWPPEVDMAEWKGSGKINFNTFNTSSQVSTRDVTYPSPGEFHKFLCEIRDVNGRDTSVKYYMDDQLVTTQYGKGFTGKAMFLYVILIETECCCNDDC